MSGDELRTDLQADAGVLEFARTDLGNAERLIAHHGKDLRHIDGSRERGWCRWNATAGRWVIGDLHTVRHWMAQVALKIYDEAKAAAGAGDQKRADALARWAAASQSASRIRAALELAADQPEVRAERTDFDADPFLVGCPNGTLDLRVGELRAAQREDMIARQTTVHYDANAPAPRWQAALELWLPDPDVREFVQRLIGSAMIGQIFEHVLPIWHGGGENGKGALYMTVLGVLGDYGDAADADLLLDVRRSGSATPEVANLHRKRLVIAAESERRKLAEAVVKKLTGGDRLQARFLYQNLFTWDPTHQIVLVTNEVPEITGTDHGIWRRILLVPFTVKLPEVLEPHELVPDFEQRLLEEEAEGVLAWCVRGAAAFVARGFHLDPPAAVVAATTEYRSDEDLARLWLDDCVEKIPGARTTMAAAYESFNRWCRNMNVSATPGSRVFYARLRDLGFEQDRTSRERFFRGLRLNERKGEEFGR